ncbi:MAG TPA: sigma-70 family RNA polymerase sigma factor [Ilumatobacteraceae bacterium]|nr:sigma-70 family RNA polymerase sigma factor [Ilumatobacteraceae bacterium]
MDLPDQPPGGLGVEERQLEDAWRAHAPAVLRFATAIVGPHDAYDIVASAFMRTTRTDSWTEIEHLDRYLMRAVRNEALNLWRQRRRQWQRDLIAVRPEAAAEVGADIDLLHAVAALTAKQRCVVFLAYWEDQSEAEIAATLELSRSQVHRILVSSRAQLRKVLK